MAPSLIFQSHRDLVDYKGTQNDLEFIDHEISANLDSTDAFEGPEKLLEIWIAPNKEALPSNWGGKTLRGIEINGIESMLDLVNCKILSKIQTAYVDSYLLSESSLFIFDHKLILKTCGTTTTLYCLGKLLELINKYCGAFAYEDIFRVFYSRRAFLFPNKQEEVHRSWGSELEYLNKYFIEDTSSHSVLGDLSSNHWYIYINGNDHGHVTNDFTMELMMTELDVSECKRFELASHCVPQHLSEEEDMGHKLGHRMMKEHGFDSLYSNTDVKHDAFAFNPCGYSSNSIVDDNYYTFHITPEQGWSYASFETSMRSVNACVQVVEALKPSKFILTVCIEGDETPKLDGNFRIAGYNTSDFTLRKLKWYNVIYCFFERQV